MKIDKIQSGGLGGFLNVTKTLRLHAPKHITCRNAILIMLAFVAYVHIFNLEMLNMSFLSFVLAFQRNNKAYKYLRCPHINVFDRTFGNERYISLLIHRLAYSVFFRWTICLLYL